MTFGQTDSIKIMSFNIWVNGAGVNDGCLLYTSDAADEGLGVDLGGRRIIKKKK